MKTAGKTEASHWQCSVFRPFAQDFSSFIVITDASLLQVDVLGFTLPDLGEIFHYSSLEILWGSIGFIHHFYVTLETLDWVQVRGSVGVMQGQSQSRP